MGIRIFPSLPCLGNTCSSGADMTAFVHPTKTLSVSGPIFAGMTIDFIAMKI